MIKGDKPTIQNIKTHIARTLGDNKAAWGNAETIRKMWSVGKLEFKEYMLDVMCSTVRMFGTYKSWKDFSKDNYNPFSSMFSKLDSKYPKLKPIERLILRILVEYRICQLLMFSQQRVHTQVKTVTPFGYYHTTYGFDIDKPYVFQATNTTSRIGAIRAV